MEQCIATHTMTYRWLSKVGMTPNEIDVYCLLNDFEYGCKVVYLTYKQIADYLGSEDKAKAPNAARRVINSLAEKGFIEINYHGGRGSANHYRLLKTPYDLFHEIVEKNPEYFSEAQIESLEKDLSRAKPAERPVENKEQPATKKVEKKQAKASVPTVDAHNWENRDEEIRKQARQLWDNRYKKCVGRTVFQLSQVRDALRGKEADDCRDKRPDKYWNMGKTDLECINWMIRSGLRVVADTGDEVEYYGDLQAISHTDNYFKNIKTVEVEKNGKTFEQFELTE